MKHPSSLIQRNEGLDLVLAEAPDECDGEGLAGAWAVSTGAHGPGLGTAPLRLRDLWRQISLCLSFPTCQTPS